MSDMSREEMIQAAVETMNTLYFEDLEFFYGFLIRYAKKKGMRRRERGTKDARRSDNP